MPLEYSTVGRITSQVWRRPPVLGSAVLPQMHAPQSEGSPLSLRFVVFPQEEPQTFYNGVGFVKRHFHPCGLGAGRGAPQALIADP